MRKPSEEAQRRALRAGRKLYKVETNTGALMVFRSDESPPHGFELGWLRDYADHIATKHTPSAKTWLVKTARGWVTESCGDLDDLPICGGPETVAPPKRG